MAEGGVRGAEIEPWACRGKRMRCCVVWCEGLLTDGERPKR
jgi:hypothetical protein